MHSSYVVKSTSLEMAISGWSARNYAESRANISSLKILVSDASDKMSGVFGLGSDIFEMMSGGLGFSWW